MSSKDNDPERAPEETTPSPTRSDKPKVVEKRSRPRKRQAPPGANSHRAISIGDSKRNRINDSHSMIPNAKFFRIHLRYNGIYELIKSYSEIAKSRNRNITNQDCALLGAVTCYLIKYKLAQCDVLFGHYSASLDVMQRMLQHVLLPSAIADYVNSVGQVLTDRGLVVVPTSINQSTDANAGHLPQADAFIAPDDMPVGVAGGLPADLCTVSDDYVPGDSIAECGLRPTVVGDYLAVLPKFARLGDCCAIAAGVFGHLNILVTKVSLGMEAIGAASMILTDEVAKIGAIYAWHEKGTPVSLDDAHVLTPLVCSGSQFLVESERTHLLLSKMGGSDGSQK